MSRIRRAAFVGLLTGLALGLVACSADPGVPGASTSEPGLTTVPTAESFVATTASMTVDASGSVLNVITAGGLRFDGCVMVADTPDERALGLMNRTDLERFSGMAFVYSQDSDGQFWMYRTLIPLSIAFIDREGKVISTAEMEPCTEADSAYCERYGSAGPYRTAVEVPGGQLASFGLSAGATVSLGGPC